jgi:hypothetical protein
VRALIYTDLQADDSYDRLYQNPSISLQNQRVRDFYQRLSRLYQDLKCDLLWDLGDLTDDRCSLSIPTIDAVLGGLNLFPKFKQKDLAFKLIGNHELFRKTQELNVGKMFSHLFRVVDTREVVHAEGITYLLCAFPNDDQELARWLRQTIDEQKKLHPKNKIIMLGHFQVLGCRMNSGKALQGVPTQAFSGIDLGLLGHVHGRQQVSPNTWYVGSPFQQDFGEADEEKFVAMLDTHNLELQWVEIGKYFPKYRTVNLETFLEEANPEGEDRFKVVLTSQAEAERFYAHPLASRAEPIYQYQMTTLMPEETARQSLELPDVLKRYMKQSPFTADNIQLSFEEMLDYGLEISTATD